MIGKSVFLRLNIKQQIKKLAHVVRQAETLLAREGKFDLGTIRNYRDYYRGEAVHPKIEKALSILDDGLHGIEDLSHSLQVKQLNFCFHQMTELIETPLPESSFLDDHPHLFDRGKPSLKFKTAGILDNLRSPFNVGSIFRSADCLGCGELALCGITPHPPNPRIEKAAMGTLDYIHWDYYEKAADAIGHYRKEGYQIAAVELTEGSVPLWGNRWTMPTAFLFGNEEFGITDDVLSLCDGSLEIPQMGMKNSMNVGNTFAIVMYERMRQSLIQ